VEYNAGQAGSQALAKVSLGEKIKAKKRIRLKTQMRFVGSRQPHGRARFDRYICT
jgi:hypothetical protein